MYIILTPFWLCYTRESLGILITIASLDADTVARLTAVAGDAPAEAEAPAAE